MIKYTMQSVITYMNNRKDPTGKERSLEDIYSTRYKSFLSIYQTMEWSSSFLSACEIGSQKGFPL